MDKLAVRSKWTPFICNVCALPNLMSRDKADRDVASCIFCKSTRRFRGVVAALSQCLLNRQLVLPRFPKNKNIRGMGLSDWHGYALRLARKFSYTNTYYHAEPRMDITNAPAALTASLDFLISSDVFEHIVSPVSVAFDNSFKMLKPGGVLVLTV